MSSNDESEEEKNLVPGLTQQDRHTKVRRLRGLSYVATDDEVLERSCIESPLPFVIHQSKVES